MAVGASAADQDAVGILGRRDLHLFAQRDFEFVADVLVFAEEQASVFAALAHALGVIADPGAALFEQALVDAQVDEVAFARNAFAVDDVEFGFAERRGHF